MQPALICCVGQLATAFRTAMVYVRLDVQVRTILSQNTTDITSQRAYTSLKQAFPTWESVRTAKPGKEVHP